MKKKTAVTVLLLGLSAVLFAGAGDIVEEIVAIVNDDVITLSEYKQQHDATAQLLRSQFQGEEYEQQYGRFKAEMLNMMITDILLMQQAKERNLNVAEDVRRFIENLKKENNIGSDDDLKRALLEQGMTYEQYVKQLEGNFLKQAVIYYEVDRTIVLDDSEVVQYYKAHPLEFTDPVEYKLRAVYFSPQGKSQDQVESLKKEISEKIKSGQAFDAVASQYSEGPGKDSGGDLGTFKKGELDKTLDEAVEKLKAGETSDWVETKNGFYLLRLEEKKESFLKPFDDIRKDVEEKLYTEKKQKKVQDYLKDLRERSYIKILKPNPLER